MTHIIDVQYAIDAAGLPDKKLLTLWANTALQNVGTNCEMTIRIVGAWEGTQLNDKWRNKNAATNVLSFPVEAIENIHPRLLGDIVICAPVVEQEAREQNKLPDAHWAHMVIHGTLHLLGYDHTHGHQAEIMEALEIAILKQLEIDNPYS